MGIDICNNTALLQAGSAERKAQGANDHKCCCAFKEFFFLDEIIQKQRVRFLLVKMKSFDKS